MEFGRTTFIKVQLANRLLVLGLFWLSVISAIASSPPVCCTQHDGCSQASHHEGTAKTVPYNFTP